MFEKIQNNSEQIGEKYGQFGKVQKLGKIRNNFKSSERFGKVEVNSEKFGKNSEKYRKTRKSSEKLRKFMKSSEKL